MGTVAPTRWSARIGARLDHDGYVRLPGALDPALVEELRQAVDDVSARHRDSSASAALHLLAFLREDRRFLRPPDHPPGIDVGGGGPRPDNFLYHPPPDVPPPQT